MTASGRTGPASPRLPRSRPRVADPGRAKWRLADLAADLDEDLRRRLDARAVTAVLAAAADQSERLWRLIEADPATAIRACEGDPRARLDGRLEQLNARGDTTESELVTLLKAVKDEVMLSVALAELAGHISLGAVMDTLSLTAEALIRAALSFVIHQTTESGDLRCEPAQAGADCGVVVLALGRLGGRELDYRSAVDLIILYDQDHRAFVDGKSARRVVARMVRDLERLLGQPQDGQVLRLDLRFRPEPSTRATALDVGAALSYYEHFGQNWERAVLIKARVIAGDERLGANVLDALSPFLWRKYFDFAAIADVHSIKRQVGAAKESGTVAGHDVRLGRGGIRDIELFVQTQQLIFGGKCHGLRGTQTLAMLRRLRREGWIDAAAAESLAGAYAFLRRTEHRLQMIADGTNQILPQGDALERFARFCGFASSSRFVAIYDGHLRSVIHHCGLLFEAAPGLGAQSGNLVFTGVADDPETLKTLTALGYTAPERVSATVRAWHSGQRPAVRSAGAREKLTDLVPKLLTTFAESADPDAAVAGFDHALEHLPAGAELFSILAANAALRRLFADILGSAPLLAEAVATHPHLLDVALDQVVGIAFDDGAMEARVEAALAHVTETEDVLDAVRDFRREEHFRIGVRLLAGELAPGDAGRAYSALAVGIIRSILRRIRAAFAADHGPLDGSVLTVLAMGQLGAEEMTAGSDLDLVVVYDVDPAHPRSSGPRPLDGLAYFTRLTQRLVSHLTVATRRGRLFTVDMQLRPSGRQGPLATKFSAFAAYQRTTAQTWEHLALTRARAIAGDATLGARVEGEIAAILRAAPRDTLRRDVAELRDLLNRDRPPANAWDLELGAGGLLDLDLVTRFLALRDVSDRSEQLRTSTRSILERIVARSPDEQVRETLIEAHRLFVETLQMARMALPASITPDAVGGAFRRRLLDATKQKSFGRLKTALTTARSDVRAAFHRLIADAAD